MTDQMPEAITRNLTFLSRPTQPRNKRIRLQKPNPNPQGGDWVTLDRTFNVYQVTEILTEKVDRRVHPDDANRYQSERERVGR